MKTTLAKRLALIVIFKLLIMNINAQPVKNEFLNPPDSARPWVYWFWLNSNVTREGITADLEAMKRVGIGGVLIMDVDQGTPPGLGFMSEQWQDMFRFAVEEAQRLGLEINMNNDAGWTGSGGPWITPENAMQTITYSETRIGGGDKIDRRLSQPPTQGDYYQDIAVLAVRESDLQATYMKDANPSMSILTKQGAVPFSFPSAQKPVAIHSYLNDGETFLDFHFDSPYSASKLEMTISESPYFTRLHGYLEISDDGKNFKTIKEFLFPNGKNNIGFDLVKATYFRIKIKIQGEIGGTKITELNIHPRYHIENLGMKSLFDHCKSNEGVSAWLSGKKAPADVILSADNIIDISQNMDSSGQLKWQAPEGRWTIIRYGHTWTGSVNGPSSLGGLGPDCDKLSKSGIQKHFDVFLKRLLELSGDNAGTTLSTFHIDSWEVGVQNWTQNMREEFEKRRRYDMIPYFPVFSGRVIGSQQETERFLWDVRKTVSELMVENYIAEMKRLCNENGIKLSMESYTTPGNDLDAANWVDEPIAEFWTRSTFYFPTMKAMASAANLNGRKIVGAESFTSNDKEKWLFHPAVIKGLGDIAFCYGINRFIFHRYAMQPWLNQKPGMTMGPWGLHYERTQTWWDYSLPWHTYLARCQYMLRQGNLVADVLNLQPEDPNYRFKNLIMKGYDYNACSPDAFLKVKFENGMLTDGAGNKYHLLVLSHLGTMTEKTLSHIKELVEQGASVLGEPPLATPGLTDFPFADQRLKRMVSELWGDDNDTISLRKVGRGQVFRGISPEEALQRTGLVPDFISDSDLNYIHRSIGGMDIYFVANRTDTPVTANCTFRVNDKSLQWWNPETGAISPLKVYSTSDEITRLALSLSPYESGFVIFNQDKTTVTDRITEITCNGKIMVKNGIVSPEFKNENQQMAILDLVNNEIYKPGTYTFTLVNGKTRQSDILTEETTMEISGSWKLKFPNEAGMTSEFEINNLESWTKLPDKEINYFSGTGTYSNTFTLPSAFNKKGNKIYLDLGDVKVMARVFVNNKKAGICWKPPYRIDISSFVHSGKNDLKIDVVNLLVNRQIGDENLPEDSERNSAGTLKTWPDWVLKDEQSPTGRHTFAAWRLWKKDDPLQDSGLIGPVKLSLVKSY